MNLDQFGGVSRCVLRIREDLGNPVISDEAFIATFTDRFPDWAERPGEADAERCIEIAVELGIASGGDVSKDYDKLLRRHKAGAPVILWTRREGAVGKPDVAQPEQVGLVLEMHEHSLVAWVPTRDGSYDVLRSTRASYWNSDDARGVALSVPALAVTGT